MKFLEAKKGNMTFYLKTRFEDKVTVVDIIRLLLSEDKVFEEMRRQGIKEAYSR